MLLAGVVAHADLVLHPDHAGAVVELPRGEQIHGFGELRAGSPAEQQRVTGCWHLGRERLEFAEVYRRVLVLDRAAIAHGMLVAPGRVDVEHAEGAECGEVGGFGERSGAFGTVGPAGVLPGQAKCARFGDLPTGPGPLLGLVSLERLLGQFRELLPAPGLVI